MRLLRNASIPAFVAFAIASLLGVRPAQAQQIKSRVMVLLDTSGSMGFHFKDPLTLTYPPSANADYPGGDGSTSYTDGVQANANMFPGKLLGNGTRDGVNSRLYAAKNALNDAINAYSGDVDFGLSSYDWTNCAFNAPGCEACQLYTCTGFGCAICPKNGNCNAYNCLYADTGFTTLSKINQSPLGCPGTMGGGNGGKILVTPGAGSGVKITPWIDGVEVFKDNGMGQPINPELRADGSTPLAAGITYVQKNWYDVAKVGDPQIACRPYVLVVETDGVDSCNGDTVAAAKGLYQDNVANPVLTYVIGLSITQTDQANLNNTAAAGGTGTARFANNQTDIEAAYADILARSVKIEVCNNKDDNCNGLVDEGFDKGAACTAGVGICQRTGIKKCDPNNNTQTTCCVNDGNPNGPCVALAPGMPMMEICNGLDDNCNGLIDEGGVCQKPQCFPETCNGKDDDCDGIIDNNLIDAGKSCGYNIGICKPGTTVCVNTNNQDVQKGAAPDGGDHLVCQGGVQPQMPMCNGCDNDCDGVIDSTTQVCYDGPMGTNNVGICHGGTQKCSAMMCPQAPSYGPCVGEVLPQKEICNGLDDDCNGAVDDVPGANVACCPSGKCGVGICTAGSMQCSGGALQCVGGQGPRPEVCNSLDDDCNGKVDDLPTIGKPCTGQNGCPGVLACDTMKMMVVCQAAQNCKPPMCSDDPSFGKPCCSNNPNDASCLALPLPCLPGKFACANGNLTCQGVVGPMAEACNCKDDNCNGIVDDNAFCPPGYDCVNCGCYGKCAGGEFPCAGGFDCINVKTMMNCGDSTKEPCYCIPNAVCNPACTNSQVCKGAPPMCHEKCEGVTCPPGSICDPNSGFCKDNTCATLHNCKTCANGSGERCDIAQSPPACVADKCCGKTCDAGQFCEPATGNCVGTCANVKCTPPLTCVNGACTMNKCAGVKCPELQLCDPKTGDCVENKCNGSNCVMGLVCCMGGCQPDSCPTVQCPDGYKCSTNPIDCSHSCDAPNVPTSQQDRVVGAGGGGFAFGCSVGATGRPNSSRSPSSGLALLGLALAALFVRRRR